MDLNSLHDVGLSSIDMKWRVGEVVFACEAAHDFEIRATGVRSLMIERFLTWGPAETIYESEFDPTYILGPRLTLTMQTGDTIRLIAESITAQVPAT